MAGQDGDDVAIKIQNMLADALPLPMNECCIYKVPHRLRKLKPDAYTPKVVSIGPFHHGNLQLKDMEGHKKKYCHYFINKRSEASLNNLVKLIKKLEPKVRLCYSENIKLDVEEFISVILVDCCFILEFLLRYHYPIQDDISLKQWLLDDIREDLMLIENQLPFFVFEEIYNLAFEINLILRGDQISFLFLSTIWYLSFFGTNGKELTTPIGSVVHFTDLYRYYDLQSSSNLPERGKEPLAQLHSTTELKEAGVKFKVNKESKCFLDLQFSRNYLRIPQLRVEDNTEMILRNMIAFEQCHYRQEPYFTDYVELFDFLINTEKDVDILVDKGIIVNWLGDNKAVAKMFNSLGKNVVVGNSNINYLRICEKLNAYCKHPWHRSMATLRRDYCNTPWKKVASVAAIFLLMLTITQTVFSILQVV